MQSRKGIPFVEAYRPKRFEDVVLDPLNRLILTNIVNTGYFPHLLFFGPPGTGKTTTMVNLINLYQEKYGQKCSELVIHLNASDDRGIDVIRNHIHQFVFSKSMFISGMKFVILDEVDSMTKIAQQALKILLQNCPHNVRFCLIANYVSRIEDGLQSELLKLRFNSLPPMAIHEFLHHINLCEQLNFTSDTLYSIQQLFGSDIRSMVNYMQANQDTGTNIQVIESQVWEQLLQSIQQKDIPLPQLYSMVHQMTLRFNMNLKNIMKDFFHYLIRHQTVLVSSSLLEKIENVVHMDSCNEIYFVKYCLVQIRQCIGQ